MKPLHTAVVSARSAFRRLVIMVVRGFASVCTQVSGRSMYPRFFLLLDCAIMRDGWLSSASVLIKMNIRFYSKGLSLMCCKSMGSVACIKLSTVAGGRQRHEDRSRYSTYFTVKVPYYLFMWDKMADGWQAAKFFVDTLIVWRRSFCNP